MNTDSNASSSSSGKLVPVWLLLLVVVVFSVIAWCNVQYTFAFVDSHMSGSAGMRLLGSYLPHAISLLVCVVVLVMWYGRLSPRDLGLSRRGLLLALPITCGFWMAVNLGVGLDAFQTTGGWELNSQLQTAGWIGLLANLVVTQLLGNALLEEIIFRGFLYEQVRRHMVAKWRTQTLASALAAFGIAIIVSLPIFVAIHIPIRLHNGILGDELVANLLRVATWGLIFTLLYAASNNLWLVIGIHALTNRPCLWFEPQHSIRTLQLIICIVLILALVAFRIQRLRSKSAAKTQSAMLAVHD